MKHESLGVAVSTLKITLWERLVDHVSGVNTAAPRVEMRGLARWPGVKVEGVIGLIGDASVVTPWESHLELTGAWRNYCAVLR